MEADCTLTLKMKDDSGDETDKKFVLENFKSPNPVGSPEFVDDVLAYVIKYRTHGDNRQKKILADDKPVGGESLGQSMKKTKAGQPIMSVVPNPAAVAAKGRAQKAE